MSKNNIEKREDKYVTVKEIDVEEHKNFLLNERESHVFFINQYTTRLQEIDEELLELEDVKKEKVK